MFFHPELSPSTPQRFSSVLSQQFLQEEVSIIKKNKSENGILIFQARGDWIIKGNIKEGDKRTISELKFRAEVHKGRETTKPKEREKSLLCFSSMAAIFCRGKKINPKRIAEIFPPFLPKIT